MTVEKAKDIMKKRKACNERDSYGCCIANMTSCDDCDLFVTDDQIEEAIDTLLEHIEKGNSNDS